MLDVEDAHEEGSSYLFEEALNSDFRTVPETVEEVEEV